MSEIEACKCGHLRNEHFDFIEGITKENKPFRKYFPAGLGKCQRCDCKQYEQTMKCSECGKEIQSDKKLCKECKKRRLREKIIGANYDAIRVGKGKTIGDIL
jgi:hypothetical protein